MNESQRQGLLRLAGDRILFDCPMAQYTTFRVGGPVDALYQAADPEELLSVVRFANKEHIPYLVVGRGSNLLVKDEGLRGLAIILKDSLASIERDEMDDMAICAGAGLSIVGLLSYCRRVELGGLEFLAGIPGTVGGALAMNAGAFGGSIGDKTKEIHVITPDGEMLIISRSQLTFSYRGLGIEKGSLILRGCFILDLATEDVVMNRMASYLEKRRCRQPLNYPSAGSVFKNPPNDHAGRLIEDAGLKGKQIGDAMISERHANFIVNNGCARAKDILALMRLAQNEVRKRTGIELEPEIKVIGQ